MRLFPRLAFVLIGSCLALAPPLAGQGTTRIVSGHVRDKDGAVLPGAVVKIKDDAQLQIRSFIVQEDGGYHFRGLKSGQDYEVWATYRGASSSRKRLARYDPDAVVVDLEISTQKE